MEADSEGRRVNMARGGCDMVCVGCTGGGGTASQHCCGVGPKGLGSTEQTGPPQQAGPLPKVITAFINTIHLPIASVLPWDHILLGSPVLFQFSVVCVCVHAY